MAHVFVDVGVQVTLAPLEGMSAIRSRDGNTKLDTTARISNVATIGVKVDVAC